MTPLSLSGRLVGAGQPAYLVAEIGINHNGDMTLARQAVEAARAAGADAVKFQNYRTGDFLIDRTLTYEYVSQGQTVVEPQMDMFRRCELSASALRELKDHADRTGIGFHSTPMGEQGVHDLVEIGAPLLKNGSDCLTHLPLIRTMARTGLPLVLSTGMGTLAEIDEAVRVCREEGNDRIVLLHCTSSYPTPAEDVHLRKIPALAAAFGCPVGFSDHTDGIVAALGAVALGACWIEKHFTLDKGLPGPDHRFSADPAEFGALAGAIRTLETSLGRAMVGPTAGEMPARESFRLSCVAARDLPAGHFLEPADIAYSRPGTGLPPGAGADLCGVRLPCAITRGEQLTWKRLTAQPQPFDRKIDQ